MAGSWIGLPWSPTPAWGHGEGTVAVLLGGAGVALGWTARQPRRLAAACALLLAAGVAAGNAAGAPAELARLRDHGRGLEGPWHVIGELVREPEVTREGSTLTLRVQQVRVDGTWRPWRGRVEVAVPEQPPRPPWPAGTRLEAFLPLRADRPPANPGSFVGDRLMARRLDFRSSLKSYSQPRVRAVPAPPLALRARERLRAAIDARFPDHRATVRALILGERRLLDDEFTAVMARSGLIHLLAISGLHVGLFLGLAARCVRLLGGSPRQAHLAGLAACLGLLQLVVPGAPVHRASVMAAVLLAGRASGRLTSGLDALGIAVLALAALHPVAVHDRGAQLSVVATLAILLTGRGRGLAGLAAVSASAQAGTAPLVALWSYRVPVAGLALNLLAVPLLPLALPLMILALVLHMGSLPGAAAAAAVAGHALDLLVALAERGANVRAALVATPGIGALVAGGWWAGLALASFPRRWARPAGALLLVACAIAAVHPPPSPTFPQLVALDVGQGDALLLRGGKQAALVDAGGYPGVDYDTGERIVLPALRHLGVRELSAIAITHAHADHAAGVPAVLSALPVGELWVGSTPPDSHFQARALEAARDSGAATLTPTSATRPFLECHWRTLAPPVSTLREGASEVLNDASLVGAWRCGPRAVLLTGDAGGPVEALWPLAGLAGGVLKVGHHGSASSTSPVLLERLRPRHSVVSVGHRNSFGLPRDEVLDRLRATGSALYRTDRDGAITLEMGPRVRVRGERWAAGRGR